MALVATVTNLVGLAAYTITVDALVEKLLALAAIDFFVHNYFI